jgi:hypothetical protein
VKRNRCKNADKGLIPQKATLEGREKAWLLLVLFDSEARYIVATNLAQLPLIRE